MVLKKVNAVTGLLSIAFMLVHAGYGIFSFLTFYYNPTLQMALAVPFMVLACVHAVLGMTSVFLQGDGVRADLYPGLNVRTVLQRVSAALILPLLILHINTYGLLAASAENGWTAAIVALLGAEILFFACIFTHIAVSLTKGRITLGVLSSRETQDKIDRVLYVLGAVLFCVGVYAVVGGQATMFLAG